MKLFAVDGPVYKFMVTLTNIFILNMLWILTSLPIITVGISTVAVFSVTLKMVDDEEGYVSKQYFKAWRENWKQGLPLGILTLVCFYGVYLDFQFFHALENHPIFLLFAGFIAAFLFGCTFLYAYPQVARYDNKLYIILRNSFRIAIKYFGWTLLLFVVCGIEVCAFLWNETTEFFGVLIGPGCLIYTISAIVKRVFLRLEKARREGERGVS
ncbi:MAG: YesL family protein [Lachnospiraceae bacterium]